MEIIIFWVVKHIHTNVNIGTVIKKPEILKFIPDHHKTKEICKHAVKKLHDPY